jgi:hypothetical protein
VTNLDTDNILAITDELKGHHLRDVPTSKHLLTCAPIRLPTPKPTPSRKFLRTQPAPCAQPTDTNKQIIVLERKKIFLRGYLVVTTYTRLCFLFSSPQQLMLKQVCTSMYTTQTLAKSCTHSLSLGNKWVLHQFFWDSKRQFLRVSASCYARDFPQVHILCRLGPQRATTKKEKIKSSLIFK